ncbi:Alpha/Beta hydrolase protein [Zychaea mexicana]|uniref:Alpha/Beta hydrolase protein n=1 Tax=Zychaea mexicana TaxID=64656 RepID=UPI0022FE911F|nr:Alpha/Beta hydrolase protein [Zychaea mexicana]KAI9495082.1 Alpha/Beta hydrolase protein [Zychaea mexicana]
MKLALPLTILSYALAAAAIPVNKKRQDADPEADAIETNGPLPSGTETYGDTELAYNTTDYPDSVEAALNGTRAVALAAVREPTAQEEEMITYYMTLAGAAYCSSVMSGTWALCLRCGDVRHTEIIETFDTLIHDTNAMVVRDDESKTIVAVFRGSASLQNWAANLDATLTNYPAGGRVHNGFYESYEDVADELTAVVFDQLEQYPDYSVATAGHSLGGATSLLCGLDLHQRGIPADKISIHTAGAPRVGNTAFANYIIDTGIYYTRLTNKRDLIPHVPSTTMGFMHAGEEYWIRSDDTMQVCENGLETPDCANSTPLFTNMADHLDYMGLLGLCL